MTLLVLVAVIAPIVLTDAATRLTPDLRLGPSAQHWFGTDEFGRDIFARALVATRLTLLMAAAATAISVVTGVLVGGLVWVVPRAVRAVVLRLIDATVAFPALVLGLIIAAILGPGSGSAVAAIGVAGIPSFARLASNLTGSIVNREFVVASRLLGVRAWPLFTRHLLPNVFEPLLMLTTSSFALTLLDISSLSFVGLGVQSPEFDFGRVLNESLGSIYVQPWGTVAPSMMLIIAGVAAMLLGDGIAAHLDPTRRVRRRRSAPVERRPSTAPDALLELSGLRVLAPDGSQIIADLSLTVAPGEVLGLVGESGSGKSTIAMAVAGLLPDSLQASAAVLRLGDLDLLEHVPRRALATRLGLVYQDPSTTYNPAVRMGAQLTEVPRVHLGMPRRQARSAVVDALRSVLIREPEKRLRQHAFALSGGILQRATIAVAMISRPSLIIADEPTTALDVTVQAEVLRLLRKLNREAGTAILFISHDIAIVEQVCDRVLVMRSGSIVEEVTGERLRAGRVADDYTRQLLAAAPVLQREDR